MSEVPNASINVRSGGSAIINAGPRRSHVVIGYASAGSLTSMTQVDLDSLVSTYVSGDAVKECGRAVDKVRAQAFFLRRNYTPVASTKALNDDGITGTSVVTVTGTATEAREWIFTVTSGGTIGTSDVDYTLSTDGGATEVSGTIVSPATSLSIGFGLTLNFTAGTLVLNDVALVSSTDPSPAICSLLKSGGGTLTVTASGTPLETVYGRVEFLTAGAIGTDGIMYRLSLDNGRTWQPVASLGVDTSIVVTDRRLDGTTTPTGVTLTLVATETVAVDTVVTFRTTAPHVAIADVLSGIDIAVNSAYKQRGWRFVSIVGDYTAAEMAQIQTKLNSLQAAKKQWFYAMMSFRDKRPYETFAAWQTAVALDRAALEADRVAPCAGYGRGFTCPITGRLDRRPAQLADVTRRLCINENIESGQKLDGPIGSELGGNVGGETASGDVTLYEFGEQVEYDADVNSTLADARITVLRTFTQGGLGTFINGSRLGTGPSSKFTRTRDRELNDLASRAEYSQATRALLSTIRRNPGPYPTDIPAQPGDPGTPLEADAINFENGMRKAVFGAIGPLANSISVVFDRTVNLTGVLGNVAAPREIKWTVTIEGVPVVEQSAVNQVFEG